MTSSSKPPRWACPLDISAWYLKYPPAFTAWLKAQGYEGYIDTNHRIVFAKLNPKNQKEKRSW